MLLHKGNVYSEIVWLKARSEKAEAELAALKKDARFLADGLEDLFKISEARKAAARRILATTE